MRTAKLFILFILLYLFKSCTPFEEERVFIEKNGDQLFFNYSSDDKGTQDLISFLRGVEKETPFVEEFLQLHGIPVWDSRVGFPSGNSWNVYIPVKMQNREDISTLWYFSFSQGKVTYYPVTRQEVGQIAPEKVWMFDYFEQTLFGGGNKEGFTFVMQTPAIETKQWYEVEYCVETWVGTTSNPFQFLVDVRCWSCVEWRPNGNTSGNYYQNGYGGAGGNAYSGIIPSNAQIRLYPNLTDIYHSESTLNNYAKDKLEISIDEFKNLYPKYLQLYNMLLGTEKKIKFKIDPTKTNGQPAAYNKTTSTIYFREDGSINKDNLAEELVHAVQHLRFYLDAMNMDHKNYEFEAKVCIDLSNIFANDGYYVGVLRGSFGLIGTTFESNYENWLKNIYYLQRFSQTDNADFNSYCDEWTNYPGITLPAFDAKLLRRLFDKQNP